MKDSGTVMVPSKTQEPDNKPFENKWDVNDAIIEKNPKVDAQLLSDFYQNSDGVIQRGKGANYSLSHPLGSNAVPHSIEEEKKENT